nr:PREDICTED: uncharacterized protein LOC102283536 [Bos mutus]
MTSPWPTRRPSSSQAGRACVSLQGCRFDFLQMGQSLFRPPGPGTVGFLLLFTEMTVLTAAVFRTRDSLQRSSWASGGLAHQTQPRLRQARVWGTRETASGRPCKLPCGKLPSCGPPCVSGCYGVSPEAAVGPLIPQVHRDSDVSVGPTQGRVQALPRRLEETGASDASRAPFSLATGHRPLPRGHRLLRALGSHSPHRVAGQAFRTQPILSRPLRSLTSSDIAPASQPSPDLCILWDAHSHSSSPGLFLPGSQGTSVRGDHGKNSTGFMVAPSGQLPTVLPTLFHRPEARWRPPGDLSAGERAQPKPFYVNVEFHHERGLVKVNDKDVSDRISSLGSQAMQMERKKSQQQGAGPGPADTPRPSYRGRASEGSGCGGLDGDYEDVELNPRFLKDNLINANGSGRPPWPPLEYQPYQSIYVGGMMVEGEAKGSLQRSQSTSEQEKRLTWPRRSYSPRSFEDSGGGYTPDCSSNENLTSSEEDFSSGQSSRVSPSPTTYRPFRDKSRSPSQNSQQSFDSSSPPTPQCQKRHRQGPVVVSEATIVGVRKTGQIWPSDGDSLSGKLSQDGAFHADAVAATCTGRVPDTSGASTGCQLLPGRRSVGPLVCGEAGTIEKTALQAGQLLWALEDCPVVARHQSRLASCQPGEPAWIGPQHPQGSAVSGARSPSPAFSLCSVGDTGLPAFPGRPQPGPEPLTWDSGEGPSVDGGDLTSFPAAAASVSEGREAAGTLSLSAAFFPGTEAESETIEVIDRQAGKEVSMDLYQGSLARKGWPSGLGNDQTEPVCASKLSLSAAFFPGTEAESETIEVIDRQAGKEVSMDFVQLGGTRRLTLSCNRPCL